MKCEYSGYYILTQLTTIFLNNRSFYTNYHYQVFIFQLYLVL